MKTADPELMRAINRFHVMDAIRRFGPIARVEISDRTQLSPTTVSAITAALLDDALIVHHAVDSVRDAAKDGAKDAAGRGRPRVMLELNPDAAFVVGVKLAPDQITVATTNFRADVLKTLTLPIRIDRQPVSVIADLVEDGVRRCIADADLTMDKINGVCVGLPGVVERGAGVCRQSPIFRERDVPFAAELKTRLGIEASVDSDVNLVTLAEHWFGMGRGLDDFIVVSVEHSLGLGVIHNGELFRGANGISPDLGDLLFRPPANGGNGGSGVGRLSEVASETAILDEVAAQLNGEADTQIRGARGMARVVELAEAGDQRVLGVLATAGEALGFAIANLIALFAPPKVILAGAALSAGELFLSPLRSTVTSLTPDKLADVSEIVVHQWGADMWARGAAAMTLRDLYGAPWNTSGPNASGPAT